MRLSRLLGLFTLLLGGLASFGCATGAPQGARIKPEFATLLDSGIVIREANGEWTLTQGGAPLRPARVANVGYWSYVTASNQRYTFSNYSAMLKLGTPQQLPHYDVRVTVAGRDQPLYGILLLSTLPSSVTDATARRTWRIAIPSQYINAATGGVVSYVHGKISVPQQGEYANWILWMSDYPLK